MIGDRMNQGFSEILMLSILFLIFPPQSDGRCVACQKTSMAE